MSFLGALGQIGKVALPAALSFVPGGSAVGKVAGKLGPLLSAAIGATGGGGVKGALKGGLAGLSAVQLRKAMDEADADRKTAHEQAGKASAVTDRAVASAHQAYDLNAPLRDAFRFGSLNLNNSANPFSQVGGASQFVPALQREPAPAPAVRL